MKIVGDIGNSDTKICVIKNNKIIKKIIFPTKLLTKSYLNKKIKFVKKYKISSSLFCSVVPKKFKILKKVLNKIYLIKAYELKKINLYDLIKIKVNINQIGSDRLANSISVSKSNSNYIIIDFGTATTFDVIIKNTYYGGIIAPGINLSIKSLENNASLIPNFTLKKVKKVIGNNTLSALRSGFFWGYTGLINNIIKLIKFETKKKFKVIATGGYSHLFKSSLDYKVSIDKDITIKGLIKIISKKSL
ncbi:MAG: type III pantothenate kinase [Candidatus Pelagibacter sp. TMED275]|nr:MAG: type III pantothenate kinase [Candidatus Pelagibacter sp. TMED275]|tara:strand:- start:1235 stop:1975 length:741 start_codon:yes stop_codon:yes gene_type:complete